MFDQKTKDAAVDGSEGVPPGELRLAVSGGPLAAAIIGKQIRLMICGQPGMPVSARSRPLPRGKIVAIGVYPDLSVVMSNGDVLTWFSNEWRVCFNLFKQADTQ